MRNRDQIVKKGTKLSKKGPKRDHFSTKVPKRDFSRKKRPTWEHCSKLLFITPTEFVQDLVEDLEILKKPINWTHSVFPSWSLFLGKVPFRDFGGKMVPFWSLF